MSLKSYLFYVSILFALVFSQATFGLAATKQNKDEHNMMEFYRLPNPDIFPELVMSMNEQGVFEKDSSRLPIIFFISEVFRRHPDRAKKWCGFFTKAEIPLRFDVGLAIRISDIPVATECITKYLGLSEEEQKPLMEEIKPYDPIKDPHSSPALLDILWGMFVASGDTRYVHRIIDALEEEINGGKNMASMAAAWSLTSMASNHPLVKEALFERSKSEEGERKKAIDAILNKLENNQ